MDCVVVGWENYGDKFVGTLVTYTFLLMDVLFSFSLSILYLMFIPQHPLFLFEYQDNKHCSSVHDNTKSVAFGSH